MGKIGSGRERGRREWGGRVGLRDGGCRGGVCDGRIGSDRGETGRSSGLQGRETVAERRRNLGRIVDGWEEEGGAGRSRGGGDQSR